MVAARRTTEGDENYVPQLSSQEGSEDEEVDRQFPGLPYDHASELNESTDNVIMERHLLRSQLSAAERQVREQQDELHFISLRLAEKEKAVTVLKEELKEAKVKLESTTSRVDDLQRTCHAQYSQNLELQHQLRQTVTEQPKALTAEEGVQKFQQQKELTLKIMRLRKKLKAVQQRSEHQLAIQECQLMWAEDPDNNTMAQLMEYCRKKEQRETSWARPSLVQVNTVSDRSDASWDLPVYKTQLTTTEDKYIDCKIKTSVFGEQLGQLRSELHPVLREYKDHSDKVLTRLWAIYSNKRSSFRPKEEFFKETKQHLTRSKVFVAEVLRRLNTAIKGFLGEEKVIKEKWRQQFLPTCHVECQADIPGPPDPEIVELRGEVEMLTDRLKKQREEHLQKEQKTTMAKDKAELNLKFLHKKIYELHRELYGALHQVYKHRFKWIPRLPNPLWELNLRYSEQKHVLDVQFNMKLGELMSKDTVYLKKFSDYFTSDDTFGIDMTAHSEEKQVREREQRERERTERRASMRRMSADREAVKDDRKPPKGDKALAKVETRSHPPPTAAGAHTAAPSTPEKSPPPASKAASRTAPERRRASAPAISFATEERKEDDTHPTSSSPPPLGRSGSLRAKPQGQPPRRPEASEVSRMDSWRLKQQMLWEAKRKEHAMVAKEFIPYVAAKSSTDPEPEPVIYIEDIKAQVQKKEAAPKTTLSKDALEVFNRLILRRRNLPLRPANEPHSIEGAYGQGYMLEGNRMRSSSTPEIYSTTGA